MQASLCRQTAEVAAGLRESWQDGTAFQALAARQAELSEQRETIEAARKVGLGFQGCKAELALMWGWPPIWHSEGSSSEAAAMYCEPWCTV